MLAKRIIPCLDVAHGRVVKGVHFVELRDAGDPVDTARAYSEQGADEITFLDIKASHEGRDTMIHMVQRVAEQVFVPLTVGGGIRTTEDVRSMLQAGADKVSMNTAAINTPDLINQAATQFGSQCVVLAIDAKRNEQGSGWTVYTHGGRHPVELDAVDWACEGVRRGAGEILLTSMDCDGTKKGYDVSVPVIASGGVGNLEHLYDGFCEGHADAALAASIFHFGEYSIEEAKKYLKKRGLSVR